MADGSFGTRDIELDIAGVTTARVLRAIPNAVKLTGITINGTAPATGSEGPIVLRSDSASGPIVWRLIPTNSEVVHENFFLPNRIYTGLYMDLMTTGWVAGGSMIIHTA
jgi:hypothetical protein